jgi:hypothetical protein
MTARPRCGKLTAMEGPPPEAASPRRKSIWTQAVTLRSGLLVVGLGVAFMVLAALTNAPGVRVDREIVRLLKSPDPQDRKRGAWLAVERREVIAKSIMAFTLEQRTEADPDVREAFIYALGRMGFSDWHLVARYAREDESGYVRQAAWLALARIQPLEFADLVRKREKPDSWDRLGIAQGWLVLGDTRGLADLFEAALDGQEGQATIAGRALSRDLRPPLDVAGRWPLGFVPPEGQPWPPELVREVQKRCQEVDVAAVIADSRPHLEKAQQVSRNLLRLTRARERIAGTLFAR